MSNIRQYKTGAYYQDEFRGERSWNGNETNVLFRSEGFDEQGLPIFSDVAMAMGADDKKDARGMALGDFDNDGDLDIVINTNPGDCGKTSVPPILLRNDIGQKRNWLSIDLVGSTANRDAIGAQVTAHFLDEEGKPAVLLRHITAGGGYASQNTKQLHFGLGEVEKIDRIEVRWPGGKTQSLSGLTANTHYVVTEDSKQFLKTTPNRDERVAVSQ